MGFVIPRAAMVVLTGLALHGNLQAGTGPTQEELNAASSSTEWLLTNHDYAGQRFSPLKQINVQSAPQLRPVCIVQAGDLNRFPTNPIVYRGVMYFSTPYSTLAVDAATCNLRWRHDWKPKGKQVQPDPTGRGGGGPNRNRGVALKDGKVVRSTPDGYLIALDADAGQLLWERQVADPEKYEALNFAPLVYGELIIVGPGISEYGVKGWLGAFSLKDGAPVWRFNTVPDDGEPGAETWPNAQARQHGGGSVWVTPALDIHRGLIYATVGNPTPDYFSEARSGVNLYTAALIVLDIKTGQLQWHRQYIPHDLHDWDLTISAPLYSAQINGRQRPVMAVGGKDGLLRVLDRESREQVFEVAVTTRSNADTSPTTEGVYTCPGVLGGMQWSSPAFHPTMNRLFVPAVDWCGSFKKADEARYVAGQYYMGGSFAYDPLEKSRGWLSALDASTGATVWKYQSSRPMVASVTTTPGNVVFTGELAGDFLTLDATTGEVLYRFNTGAPITGGVITYAVAEKQYVAVTSGAAGGYWKTPPAGAVVIIFGLP